MAIAFNHLTNGSSATDASSYSTASVSPASNALVLAWVITNRSGVSAAPTCSGNGLTWTQVATITFNTIASPNRRLTLFKALGASPSAGAVTFDFGGNTQLNALWGVSEFSSVNTTTPVVQSATNATDSANGLTVTLAAFGSATNAAFGCFSNNNFGGGMTPGAGFTEIFDFSIAENNTRLQAEYQLAEDTTVDVSGWASNAGAGIAIEIAEAGGIIRAAAFTQAAFSIITPVRVMGTATRAGTFTQSAFSVVTPSRVMGVATRAAAVTSAAFSVITPAAINAIIRVATAISATFSVLTPTVVVQLLGGLIPIFRRRRR